MPSNSKGSRRERELVNKLDEDGYAVMRAPASGAATERELPDVLAGDGEDFYIISRRVLVLNHLLEYVLTVKIGTFSTLKIVIERIVVIIV